MEFKIYWNDLTETAQKQLKGLWHENIDLTPIAIIVKEE